MSTIHLLPILPGHMMYLENHYGEGFEEQISANENNERFFRASLNLSAIFGEEVFRNTSHMWILFVFEFHKRPC